MSENLTGLFPGVTKRGCLDRVLRDVIFAVMIVVFFAIVSPLASGVSPAFRTLIANPPLDAMLDEEDVIVVLCPGEKLELT